MRHVKMTKELYDELKGLSLSLLDEDGHEVPSPKTMFLPGATEPLSIKEQIQRLMRAELSRQMAAQGQETFEEANDFDVPDEDPEPMSNYLLTEDEIPVMKEEVSVESSDNPEDSPEEQPKETTES